ncbi:peroxiredoxin [Candidatus Methylocalor cossyra]|uniref:Glutathione-dependent peroxiredoxin n=1 Tax=Candidatus Methylocalor cossyra TaxID=3108543 RepID=A0ABM9NH99_9GAMM
MTIHVGERLPEGTLQESTDFDPATGCPLKPQNLSVTAAAQGKKLVLFGVPGAFTPTCSAQHLPGYLAHLAELKAKGVDEVWCLAVNDAFVMAAWGRDRQATGKIRLLADGSAAYVKKLGLELDLSDKGMGVRSQRFAMIVEDGVVTHLAVEAPGKFEVSSAEAILTQL